MESDRLVTPIDFDDFEVGAKIDYVTIATPGQCRLPALDGTRKWSRKEHYRRLSIHDPSPGDVHILRNALCNPEILELEVAVDFRPKGMSSREEHSAKLKQVYRDLLAGLHPYGAILMSRDVMGVFNPFKGGLEPCDMRLPTTTYQAVWGHRTHPAQVKLYVKEIDQGQGLDWQRHVTRVEVRLSGEGLTAHGLNNLTDLFSFKFRKQLMPYFRTVYGCRRRRKGTAHEPAVMKVVRARRAVVDAETWSELGARGFRHDTGVVMQRQIAANNRIGQALGRLELRHAEAKFALWSTALRCRNAAKSRGYSIVGPFRMTYC